MASERFSRLRRVYGIALSCMIVVAGLCLAVACVGIYLSGDEPYSREAVAAAFHPISIPVYLCLVMAVGGFVLQIVFPAPAAKPAALKQPAVIRKRLLERVDPDGCGDALRAQILSEQRRRKKQNRICAFVLVVCALTFLIYALDGSHFLSSDINRSMIRAMAVLLPCLGIGLANCIVTVYAGRSSLLREIELLKQCPKKDAPQTGVNKSDPGKKMRLALLLAAAALTVFGFCSGGTADVLTKAVNICTECIGLG